MIHFLGWMAFAFGGAYLFGGIALVLGSLLHRGGLESIGVGIFFGAIVAIAWLAFAAWLSPLTVSF